MVVMGLIGGWNEACRSHEKDTASATLKNGRHMGVLIHVTCDVRGDAKNNTALKERNCWSWTVSQRWGHEETQAALHPTVTPPIKARAAAPAIQLFSYIKVCFLYVVLLNCSHGEQVQGLQMPQHDKTVSLHI